MMLVAMGIPALTLPRPRASRCRGRGKADVLSRTGARTITWCPRRRRMPPGIPHLHEDSALRFVPPLILSNEYDHLGNIRNDAVVEAGTELLNTRRTLFGVHMHKGIPIFLAGFQEALNVGSTALEIGMSDQSVDDAVRYRLWDCQAWLLWSVWL